MTDASPLQLSVLIATRSRAAVLERTLASLCELDARGLSWELVVVDNGSTDATPELLEAYRQRLPLVTLRQPEPGKNRSLNAALGHLRGATTLLTDDDVLLPRDWLQAWQRAVDRWPGDAVFGGRILPKLPAGTPAWIAAETFPFRAQCFAAFDPRQDEGPYEATAFGPNFAVRTRLFDTHRFADALGPVGTTYAMGGETEFLMRLRRAGHRVIYAPSVVVEHVIEPDRVALRALFARARNAGRGYEVRRLLSRPSTRAQLQRRLYTSAWPKIVYFALLYMAAAPLPEGLRFRQGYRLQRAWGRRQQLHDLLRSDLPPIATR